MVATVSDRNGPDHILTVVKVWKDDDAASPTTLDFAGCDTADIRQNAELLADLGLCVTIETTHAVTYRPAVTQQEPTSPAGISGFTGRKKGYYK